MDGARKKNILLIHLGTQYAKTDCRNEIYTKNWVRRTWPGKKSIGRSTVKVNGQRWSTGQRSTVNGQRLEMTSADQWMLTQLGLSGSAWRPDELVLMWQRVGARGGAWGRVKARGGAWRRCRIFEGRVGARAVSDGGEISTNV